MPMSMPERNDERVALFPIETALADLRRAFAAKHMIDHRARVSVRLRLIVGREKLDRALDRRHRRSAAEWIAIFQQIAVKAISGGRRFYQFVQRLLGVAPFVMKKICKRRTMPDGRAEFIHNLFTALLDRLAAFRIALLHDLMQRLHQWKIQTVQPQHRLAGIIGVIMPGELRRENQITGLHDALLAVDRRISAVALKDETQSRRRVAVRPRIFAGLDVLK